MHKPWVTMLVLAFLLLVAGLACGTPSSEGVVAHKSITGSREGSSQTVLTNRPSDNGTPLIDVEDADLKSLFAVGEEHAFISDSLAFQIESRFDEVKYVVNIRLESSGDGGTQPYITSREVFNQLRVGETVKFKTKQEGDFPTLVEIEEP
ncbi:MAG: hypothetical protein C1O27_001841 [Chloroflexi bacterium]|jgi:hypothetical protein|nr:MAG: hypothetical protein C1O27_001841 [Chloroflexota bacterium]